MQRHILAPMYSLCFDAIYQKRFEAICLPQYKFSTVSERKKIDDDQGAALAPRCFFNLGRVASDTG
jgi:hypothetical protein